MKLTFSNPSRSYDENHQRVRFWGYDNALEVAFFVELDALKKLCPKMNADEDSYLNAFDASLTQIHRAAEKIHQHNGQGTYSYILTANEF